MNDPLNPQAREMADESMVRNLAAQADAIWPQERPLFDRYGLAADTRVLDAGCGTGEITLRLADIFGRWSFLGVDLIDEHLDLARSRCARFGDRVRFENRNIFELGLPDAAFDLVVCRHVVQAIPRADRALAELMRVTKRGGWLHVIAEDYLMINFEPRELDADDFWHLVPRQFGAAQGINLRIGRSAYGILKRLGISEIYIDYVTVDPLRAPRETFVAIWEAWRDGYADTVSEHIGLPRERFIAHFEDMIATLRDPNAYAVWHVPVVAARVP